MNDNTSNTFKNRFNIIKEIGKGSFCKVYLGYDKFEQKKVAIKIEKKELDNKIKSRIEHEYNLYSLFNNCEGICNILWHGKNDNLQILIMDQLGPSLNDLFLFCDNKFSLKTTCMIAIQLLKRLRTLHNKQIIHRDIKPDNLLIGLDKEKHIIYLIDLGLSKIFNHNYHIKINSFKGSLRYCSLRNHRGIEQSYRDDLESLGYMLIFFIKSSLPWQNNKIKHRMKKKHYIYTIKKNYTLEKLCKDLPIEFLYYMKYTQLLEFKEKPDYTYLIHLFKNILKNNNMTEDDQYDWIIKLNQV